MKAPGRSPLLDRRRSDRVPIAMPARKPSKNAAKIARAMLKEGNIS